MDRYDEMLDMGAKNVMGISLDRKEWSYDEVVNNYIILLDYYGNKAPIEIFSNMENLARLNLSFNYCTGQVLVDYQKEYYSIDGILEKVRFNEHYRTLLEVGNSIRNRFVKEGLDDIADELYFDIFIMAEVLYNFETDKELYKTKIYS